MKINPFFPYGIRRQPPKGSVSVVFIADNGEIGLGLRGHGVEQPNTWAAIGGWREENELPLNTIHREVWEELGMRVPGRVEYLGEVGPHQIYLSRVREPFAPHRLNWENQDFQWKSLNEWKSMRLHPELRRVLMHTKMAEGTDWEKYYNHPKKKTPYDYYPTSYPKDRPSPWQVKPEKDYWSTYSESKSELNRLQRIRLTQGGLPMNWLKTFGYSYNGLKNLLTFLNLPIPKDEIKHPQRQWPREYPPFGEKPEKNPYGTPYINPKHPYRYKEWEHEE